MQSSQFLSKTDSRKQIWATLGVFLAALQLVALVPKVFANSEVSLAKFKPDNRSGDSELRLVVDDSFRAVAFRYYDENMRGVEGSVDSLPRSVVLLQRSGVNVFTLQGGSFDPQTGGALTLSFLQNGLTGARGNFQMQLVQSNSRWFLEAESQGQWAPVNTLNLKMNRVLGGVVGVESISAEWAQSLAAIESAGELQVLKIESDVLNSPSNMRFNVDENGDLVSLMYYEDGRKKSEFSMSALMNSASLMERSGYQVVKLTPRGPFNSHEGGEVDLVYLSNAFTNSYGTFPMSVVRRGNGWALETNGQSGRREFTSMYIKSRKLFGQVIGIQSINVK